jgi:hypothetical protein
VIVDLLIDRGAFLRNFQQTWTSHFSQAKSLEHGSAADFPFAWIILLRNWDTLLPAVLGIALLVRRTQKLASDLLPLAWLAVTMLVFATHKPWWPYYYIHTAIPFSWCASVGVAWLLAAFAQWRPSKVVKPVRPEKRALRMTDQQFPWHRGAAVVALVAYAFCALPWMVGRIYLQVRDVRGSPQTYSSLVLTQIQDFKPFTDWIYADDIIYSFHAGIPMPCQLAVVPLKRFWCGDMTAERIASEVQASKPGVILLRNDGREVPFQALLGTEYRLVYQDVAVRLYALASIARKRPL